jgi:ABC-type glycerol-3-phosphate transport system substrate-binding protein
MTGEKEMSRLLKVALLASAMLAPFVSFAAHAQTTVSVLGWASVIDYRKGPWAKLVKAFEAENPGIRIRDVGVPTDEALNQITTMVLGGNAPDVAQVFGVWMPQLVQMGAVAPVDPFIPSGDLEKYPKISRDALTFDRHLMAVPFYPGPIMMFYNRDLLRKAGFESAPRTWAEFKNAVEKICKLPAEGGGKVYGIGLRTSRNPNSGQWAIPFIWGHGGKLVGENGKITLTDPGTVAAFKWYQDLSKSGCTPEAAAHNDTRNLFAQGRAGFIFEGPWGKGITENLSGGKLKVGADANVWAAPMPAAADGRIRMMANDNPLVVFTQSKNKEAAIKFIRFIVDNQKAAEDFFTGTGEIATSNVEILSKSPVFSKEPLTQVMIDSMQYSDPMPINHPQQAAITDVIAVTMQKVMQGADPKKELEAAQAEVDRLTQ